MRRHRLRPAVVALLATTVLALAAPAGAQTVTTTTAPPPTTAPPATTVPTSPATTTPGGGTTPTTGAATTATTAPAASSSDDDGSSIPWIPIAVAVVVLALLVALVALLARRRGASRQHATDWRHGAADATAEAGATARLLSQGTPPSGQIAQQLLASLRSFEDLAQSATNDADAATAERARRALQTLGLAIDSDYRLRRAGGTDPQQIARSAESVQNAATEADRTLRGVYRTFTNAD